MEDFSRDGELPAVFDAMIQGWIDELDAVTPVSLIDAAAGENAAS